MIKSQLDQIIAVVFETTGGISVPFHSKIAYVINLHFRQRHVAASV